MKTFKHDKLNYTVEQISDTVGILRLGDDTTIGQIPMEIVEDSLDWNEQTEIDYGAHLGQIFNEMFKPFN